MTFTYEGDREIALDLLRSLELSFGDTKFDVFLTDDASPSNTGAQVERWASDRGLSAVCLRTEQNQGFRGAVERTLRLLRRIAEHPTTYDYILRIDTDALVIREGIGHALGELCQDPRGLYGVIRVMRPRDRVALLLDLMPFGLKRKVVQGRVGKDYAFSRIRPVWWWRIGLVALLRGFRFGYVEGSCYALGGQVPKLLLEIGFLDCYDPRRFGLITSEEDVVVTMLCRAAGLPLYQLDRYDSSWKDMNIIGAQVLERSFDAVPYVMHALKPDEAEHLKLREQVKARMPLFRAERTDLAPE